MKRISLKQSLTNGLAILAAALILAGCASTPLPPPPPTVQLFKPDAPRATAHLKSSWYDWSALHLIGERYCGPTLWKPKKAAQTRYIADVTRNGKTVTAEIPAGKNVAFRLFQVMDGGFTNDIDFTMDVEPGAEYEFKIINPREMFKKVLITAEVKKDGKPVPINVFTDDPCDKYRNKS